MFPSLLILKRSTTVLQSFFQSPNSCKAADNLKFYLPFIQIYHHNSNSILSEKTQYAPLHRSKTLITPEQDLLSFLGLIFHSTMLRAIVIILVLGRSYTSIAGSRFIPMWSFGRAIVHKLVCCLPFIRGPLFRFSFFWLVPCCYCPNQTERTSRRIWM